MVNPNLLKNAVDQVVNTPSPSTSVNTATKNLSIEFKPAVIQSLEQQVAQIKLPQNANQVISLPVSRTEVEQLKQNAHFQLALQQNYIVIRSNENKTQTQTLTQEQLLALVKQSLLLQTSKNPKGALLTAEFNSQNESKLAIKIFDKVIDLPLDKANKTNEVNTGSKPVTIPLLAQQESGQIKLGSLAPEALSKLTQSPAKTWQVPLISHIIDQKQFNQLLKINSGRVEIAGQSYQLPPQLADYSGSAKFVSQQGDVFLKLDEKLNVQGRNIAVNVKELLSHNYTFLKPDPNKTTLIAETLVSIKQTDKQLELNLGNQKLLLVLPETKKPNEPWLTKKVKSDPTTTIPKLTANIANLKITDDKLILSLATQAEIKDLTFNLTDLLKKPANQQAIANLSNQFFNQLTQSKSAATWQVLIEQLSLSSSLKQTKLAENYEVKAASDLSSLQVTPLIKSDIKIKLTTQIKSQLIELGLINDKVNTQPAPSNIPKEQQNLASQNITSLLNLISTSANNANSTLLSNNHIQQMVNQLAKQINAQTSVSIASSLNDIQQLTDSASSIDLPMGTFTEEAKRLSKGAISALNQINQNIQQQQVQNFVTNQLQLPSLFQGVVNSSNPLNQLAQAFQLLMTGRVNRAINHNTCKPIDKDITTDKGNKLDKLEQSLADTIKASQHKQIKTAQSQLKEQNTLFINLPIYIDGQFSDLDIAIEVEPGEEADKNDNHKLIKFSLKFDLAELGKMLTKAVLIDHELKLNIYTENNITENRTNKFLPQLRDKLANAGITLVDSRITKGKIPDNLWSENALTSQYRKL
ncbi:flagellar hook-length control protein FliK [Catenovulum sp. SM1970]|uniref:flagellar hook-length control protein FliK n=1 Tax=Marinifaba aquimaris TaxID=2741323 RepID=UPI001574CBD6|nr:flagellar hook-length control protein FliK [Marinifaba aquimaris]NTS76368.1 flagellar hook-length control protein FliK [Marinifaba aquimaris]